MILQEIIENWSFVITLSFILLGIIIFGLILLIYSLIDMKIHKSYHKGYNKAKDDKVQYYKTIRELTEGFDIIFNELTKEGSGYMYKASTLELILEYRTSLDKYYNN